jgi:hypothetical protein
MITALNELQIQGLTRPRQKNAYATAKSALSGAGKHAIRGNRLVAFQ